MTERHIQHLPPTSTWLCLPKSVIRSGSLNEEGRPLCEATVGQFLTFDLVTKRMLERPLHVGRLPVVNLRITVGLTHCTGSAKEGRAAAMHTSFL